MNPFLLAFFVSVSYAGSSVELMKITFLDDESEDKFHCVLLWNVQCRLRTRHLSETNNVTQKGPLD